MTLPNFLIIGAMRGGTTSLHQYLRQHPQIYMSPIKEPAFFALEGEKLDFRGPGDLAALHGVTTNLDSYRALFMGAAPHQLARGEASTWYLMSEKAPARIRHYIPEAKLIAILRDPCERAYSSFLHLVGEGREPLLDFAAALGEEERRTRENWEWLWRYAGAGLYYEQLDRYNRLFSRDQIRVYLQEDLNADPAGILQRIFRFLGVDPDVTPDTTERYNVSGFPKDLRWHRFLTTRHRIKTLLKPLVPSRLRSRAVRSLVRANLVKSKLPVEHRMSLIGVFRDDILKLQDLIDRDLSRWLKP